MISRIQSLLRDPLLIIGAMCPLVLLAKKLNLPLVQKNSVSDLPCLHEFEYTFFLDIKYSFLNSKRF